MARDKYPRPCLPLKPQEKKLIYVNTNKLIVITGRLVKRGLDRKVRGFQ
jgi:hypothetical protein